MRNERIEITEKNDRSCETTANTCSQKYQKTYKK